MCGIYIHNTYIYNTHTGEEDMAGIIYIEHIYMAEEHEEYNTV